MKISNILNSCFINSYQNNYKSVSTQKRSTSDTVEISSEAMELLSQNEDLRTEKIEDIRSRIASGCYTINSTDIVDKMIKNANFM